eukprot:jgi/Hompol1/3993/HPOL_000689-RA
MNSVNFHKDGLSDPFCEIHIRKPGAFEYHVEFSKLDAETSTQISTSATGYFVVEPRLHLPNDSIIDPSASGSLDRDLNGSGARDHTLKQATLLPIDGITILSVIPKWMPTLAKWPPFFKLFNEAGYNMVHLAPLNQRGVSNSPYSIYDQLAISDDLFEEPIPSEPQKEMMLKMLVDEILRDSKILCMTDIVWNHTACNSSWLLEHPEAGYNLKTAPHLRPAYELDEAILQFSDDITTVYGKPSAAKTEQEIGEILSTFFNSVLPTVNLWQFYVVEAKQSVDEFERLWTAVVAPANDGTPLSQRVPEFDRDRYKNLEILQLPFTERARILSRDALIDPKTYRRFAKTINMSIALSFVWKLSIELSLKPDAIKEHAKLYAQLLDEINLPFYQECDGDLACIREQIGNRARYLRVAEHGPRLGPISRLNPLVDTYFTRLPVNNITKSRHPDELALAANGWIWNADPLVNFAAEGSKAYLRREVIAWGDCVKLRYGNGPDDNKWLWDHQAEYTRKMARIFHGLRIDNCHSTPIHVAQYLLDVARTVNPDLYVFAELFTGSEEKDIIFVSKLGINSLIREAMNAWDPQELSRQVHRQGGAPVGSFTIPAEYFPLDMLGHNLNSVFYEPCREDTEIVVELRGSTPHSLLMDCTHDNETPHQKRSAEDTLPNAAVVAMSMCAIGSVKGYDEIVPELLNVVTESRKYRLPDTFEGIIPAKSILNSLHAKMAREGYSEIHVNQEHDFISIHRVHPVTHDGYLLIARSAFRGASKTGPVHSPIILRNQSVHVLESATLSVQTGGLVSHASSPYVHDHTSDSDTEELHPPSTPTQLYHAFDAEDFEQALERSRTRSERKHSRKVLGYISGLPSTLEFSTVLSHITHTFVELVGETDSGDMQTVISVDANRFVPGSIVLYRTWVVGTGIEQDAVLVGPSRHGSPESTPLERPHRNLFVATGPGDLLHAASEQLQHQHHHHSLSVGSELTVPTISVPEFGHNLVPDEPIGAFERLWELLGMNHRNTAIEIVVRFGFGVLGSNELWFTSLNSNWTPGLYEAVNEMNQSDINMALFRTGVEESDFTGDSVYDIPGFGPLPYCGLQGIISGLEHLARANDLGAPLFQNLRQGRWLSDYIVGRLDKLSLKFPGLSRLRDWLRLRLKLVSSLSAAFIPKYFAIVVVCAYQALKYRALTLKTNVLGLRDIRSRRASSLEHFGEACMLSTFQLYGITKSTGLFPIKYPGDIYGKHDHTMDWVAAITEAGCRHPSLAAGLPHFATHHMRCWGRDIFISLRGMFLNPAGGGPFAAARAHIIAFGSVLRHGLIPNLLDQGVRPRYNARDATWFWLRSVRDYCRFSPEGYAFLGTPVHRRFIPLNRYRASITSPSTNTTETRHDAYFGDATCVADSFNKLDDDLPDTDTFIHHEDPRVYQYTSTVAELCQEILERHANGISFREWNAGPDLDHAMRSEGFDIQIKTLLGPGTDQSGIVTGGSRWNCGTWMDKMGDSEKAGTRGVPSSPRDGAAIEIVGLVKATLHWILEEVELKGKSWWRWTGVAANGEFIPYTQWNNNLHNSFETYYYIPQDASLDRMYFIDRPELVNRRGIYKDVFASSIPYLDYQLRPNMCIAMATAPELFDPDHARTALTVIKQTLIGPLGIKTLDPKDWAYRGVYNNSDDSSDPAVAHGFNYHQGPEWLWVMGYFLRAYIYFFTKAQGHDPTRVDMELVWVQRQLLVHKKHMADVQASPFAGLPELTNENGAFCSGSCPTQAWSSATLLEVVMDLLEHRRH